MLVDVSFLSGEQYDDHCFVRDPVDLVNCPVDVTAMRSVHPVLGHSFLFLHPPYCFYTAACDPNIAQRREISPYFPASRHMMHETG